MAKKSIALGDYVAPGQQVVAISQIDALWVTANYRETQLAYLDALWVLAVATAFMVPLVWLTQRPRPRQAPAAH